LSEICIIVPEPIWMKLKPDLSVMKFGLGVYYQVVYRDENLNYPNIRAGSSKDKQVPQKLV